MIAGLCDYLDTYAIVKEEQERPPKAEQNVDIKQSISPFQYIKKKGVEMISLMRHHKTKRADRKKETKTEQEKKEGAKC